MRARSTGLRFLPASEAKRAVMNDNEPISDKFRGFTQQFHTLTSRLTEEERDLVMVLILEEMQADVADDPEAASVLDRTLALLKEDPDAQQAP